MAAAYYKVTFPDGYSYVHGGNNARIRHDIEVLSTRVFPPGTSITFRWGHRRRVGVVLFFTEKGRVKREPFGKLA